MVSVSNDHGQPIDPFAQIHISAGNHDSADTGSILKHEAPPATACKAGIRQGENERKSLHLFRHNVATALLQGGVQQPVISATLGHASPDSLDRYLSAEFKRLKECSLSIEYFPVGKGVFDV